MEQSPKIEREDIKQRMRKSNCEREREGKREGGGRDKDRDREGFKDQYLEDQ